MEEKNDEKFSFLEDLGEGTVWDEPQCIKCLYNQNGFCSKYNKKRAELVNEIDIFDCKEFIDPKEQAMKAMGLNNEQQH